MRDQPTALSRPTLMPEAAAPPRRRVPWRKRAVYLAQAAPALPLYALIRALPAAAAARFSGRLFSLIGVHLAISRRAHAQLSDILPDLTRSQVAAITAGVWRNVGYIAAEYIHIAEFAAGEARIQLNGAEHLRALADSGRPVLLFSAHLANWAMATIAARRCGLDPHFLYRPFNNPIVEHFSRATQRKIGAPLIAKSPRGTRRLVQVLGAGGQVIMLVDQRQSSGIEVPFFGRPAQTSASLAKLAYRYDAAIVPIRVERIAVASFRVTVEPPLTLPRTADAKADIAAVMTTVNQRLEAWIRARPEQWLWLHRRWGKAA